MVEGMGVMEQELMDFGVLLHYHICYRWSVVFYFSSPSTYRNN